MTSTPSEQGSVASVERAGAILQLFLRDSRTSIALTEIAGALELPVSTTHRLLRALCRSRLVQHDPVSRRYELSLAVHQHGKTHVNEDLAAAALVPIERLHRATGEGCHIVVPDLPEVVFVERRDSTATFRFHSERGVRVPANCTSTGKVLLAHASRPAQEQVLTEGLGALTPSSITDPERLRSELEAVRERGYATSRDETEIGMTSMAVPIRDPYGRVIAAVGLAGRTERIRPMPADALLDALTQTSLQVTVALLSMRYAESWPGRPEREPTGVVVRPASAAAARAGRAP